MPYLKLSGTVIGGWLMSRSAEAAQAQLSGATGDEGFLSAKVGTALHFLHHMLVEAPAWRDRVVNGASSTLALREDQF